jgi:hypothetical protein
MVEAIIGVWVASIVVRIVWRAIVRFARTTAK